MLTSVMMAEHVTSNDSRYAHHQAMKPSRIDAALCSKTLIHPDYARDMGFRARKHKGIAIMIMHGSGSLQQLQIDG